MEAVSSSNSKVERKLKYKALIEKGAKIGESMANQNIMESLSSIMDIINNCDDISTTYAREARVENTADYLMDAQIIKMSHDLMGSMTEKMANNDFREDEFIASLVNLMTTQPDKVLDAAIDCCRTAKFQLSLLGTFDFDESSKPLEVTKKVRVVNRAAPLPSKSAPENIKQISKVDKGAEKINIVQSELKRIFRQRKTDSIPYFEAVINPQSYMKTVDAAFQMAFLVRDGIVGIKQIDDAPHIFLKESTSRQSQNNSHADESDDSGQAIMALDPPKWRQQIEKYNLKAPVLHLESEKEAPESDSD